MQLASSRSCAVSALIGISLALVLLLGVAQAKGQSSTGAHVSHQTVQFHEPQPREFSNHTGFTRIFNGKNLANWEGDPRVWHVEDGAIVGESSKKNRVFNSYIWRKGLIVKNFDLKLEIKCQIGGGSGIQYRSQTGLPWIRPLHPGQKPPNLNWMMTGPQADFWFPVNPKHAQYTGQFYSENTPLGIVAWRGEVVESEPGKRARLIGTLGNRQALGGYVKTNAWNQYEIIARGGVMMHIINGHLMAVLIDDNPDSSNNKPGKIGIELEGTPAKVSVRDIWIRKFK